MPENPPEISEIKQMLELYFGREPLQINLAPPFAVFQKMAPGNTHDAGFYANITTFMKQSEECSHLNPEDLFAPVANAAENYKRFSNALKLKTAAAAGRQRAALEFPEITQQAMALLQPPLYEAEINFAAGAYVDKIFASELIDHESRRHRAEEFLRNLQIAIPRRLAEIKEYQAAETAYMATDDGKALLKIQKEYELLQKQHENLSHAKGVADPNALEALGNRVENAYTAWTELQIKQMDELKRQGLQIHSIKDHILRVSEESETQKHLPQKTPPIKEKPEQYDAFQPFPGLKDAVNDVQLAMKVASKDVVQSGVIAAKRSRSLI